MKLCYVNDPTLTFNENEEEIRNEFLSSGNIQPRTNTTEFTNINNNVLAITGPQNQETSIYIEENNQIEDNPD